MIEALENQPHICFECDAEFIVHTPYDMDEPVSFCPFCGSEVELEEDELDDLDEDEDEF